ncbi:MAG: S8 family peptidase [Nitrososphaeraceae archaeon]
MEINIRKIALFFALAVSLFSASFSMIGHYRNNSAFALQDQFGENRLEITNSLSNSPSFSSSSVFADHSPFSQSSITPMVQSDVPYTIPNFGKILSSSKQDPVLNTADITDNSISSRLALQKEARQAIGGQYIVVLKQEANTLSTSGRSDIPNGNEIRTMANEMRSKGAEILNIYHNALSGYTVKVEDNSNLLTSLKDDPRVAYVERDQEVHMFSQVVPTGVERIGAGPLNSNVAKSATQSGGTGGGNSVNADIAILDSGIDLTHPDLNVYAQKTFVAGTSSANDDNGHGTHVAGIAAAKDNSIGVVGVAPGARLWAVKVLDSSGAGAMSDVIAGIDYITQHANEIDVVNLSFGCRCDSSALNAAINSAVSAGITFVAAAGNSGADASNFSPASNPNVIAVSAIADSDGKCGGLGQPTQYGNDDTFATFSDYGPKITIAAPGVNILSTYTGGSYTTLSGTSMAAPHVAGAAALYKASHPNASPAEVKNSLINFASKASTACDSDGHGYFSGPSYSTSEPLLYVKNMR